MANLLTYACGCTYETTSPSRNYDNNCASCHQGNWAPTAKLLNLYITDKSGKRYWKTNVSAEWSVGERRNLEKRLAAIKRGDQAFQFVDAGSARIVEETA